MARPDVLKALLLPFTAGNSRTSQTRPVHLDGTTSTVVISMFFISLLYLLVKAMVEQEHLISFVGIKFLLSFVVFLGLVSCLAIVIVIKVKGFHSVLERRQDVTSSRLQKLVLWSFGMLSITYCLLKSGHIVECINILDHGPIMECVYYGMIVVYLPVQMLSLAYLTPYRFKRSLWIQYMILLMLAPNLTMWVYSLINHNYTHSHANLKNDTWNTNCTNQTFTYMLQVSKNILPPIFLEYSMLAITMTHNLSVNWETTLFNDISGNDITENHSLAELSESTSEEFEAECRTVPINDATALLSPGVVQRSGKKSFLFYLILLLLALLSASHFIGYIVRITGHSGKQHTWIDSVELVISILMMLCTINGYYLVARDVNPPTYSHPISGGEYVFIVSSIGYVTGCGLRIMTCLQLQPPNYVIAVSRIIFGILSYLQTVLILHACRCSPKLHYRNKTSLKRTLLLLSLYNLGAWIIETFLLGSFPTLIGTEKQLLGHDLWELSFKSCHPMTVFFRFASALEFFELYKKFGN